MSYQRVLFATDFAPDAIVAARKALDIVQKYQAKLSILHVVEYFPLDPSAEMGLPVQFDMEQVLIDAARRHMSELLNALGMPETPHWIEIGSTKTEILRVAERERVDLIVLGSHGRHGLGLLLGSTANAVLHHARCDVLAVRLAAKK
ncbi:MAG: universal stress protein [Gammaproteobacteria bacterium]|nr:universal stress protein [Gammaproteobacteria bacterium]